MTRATVVGASQSQIFAVTMAYDAFRICVGLPTKNHPPQDVVRWMSLMLKLEGPKTGQGETHGS
jgi:hypothetical protein